MACRLQQDEVSQIVLSAIREKQQDPSIGEGTRFWADLRLGRSARRAFFRPIRRPIEEAGCVLSAVKEQSFDEFKTVQSVIEAVWQDLQQPR